LTARGDEILLEALAAGMRGCLLKSHASRDLVQASANWRMAASTEPGLAEAVVQAYRSGAERPVDP